MIFLNEITGPCAPNLCPKVETCQSRIDELKQHYLDTRTTRVEDKGGERVAEEALTVGWLPWS
jgi:hypothetical protein